MLTKTRVPLLATLTWLSIAQPALAQAPEEPHLRRGIDLSRDGDWDGALVELRRAYAVDPRPETLREIGRAAVALRRWADALDALEKYQTSAGAAVPVDRRDEVKREIDKLRTRVATLLVTTSAAGVDISIDDVPVGRAPLAAPVRVSAGHRKVTAARPGQPPVSQVVELAGGDERVISLTVPDDEAPAPPPVAPARPGPAAPPVSAARRYPFLPWLVTAGVGAGALATGVLALQASNDLRSKLATYPVTPGELHSLHGKTAALALATDALLGATILVGGLSIYYTVKLPTPADQRATAPLRVSVDLAGVRLSGTF
jgi:hypothetical protein